MQLQRSLILAAALLVACTADPSTRWEYVTSDSDGAMFYLDKDSVKVVGDHVEAIELVDFRDDGSNWKSMKSRVHYRCSLGSSAWIDSDFYSEQMGKGTVVSSRQERDRSFKKPAPGTPSVELNRKACSLAASRA